MAQPPVIKEAAALKHEALSSYETSAALLQHKVEFPPDKDSTSTVVDEWISEAYIQWIICSNFWKPAGIKKAAWNDMEYALLACLPLVNRELIDESGGRFNELVHRAVRWLFPRPGLVFLTRLLSSQHKYSIPNLRPVPLDTPSPSPEPELRVQMPTPVPPPPKTMTPQPAPRPTTPPPQKETTPAPRKRQSMAPVTPQRAAPLRAPNLAGSVPKINLPTVNPAANIASSNVRAPGSAPYNIPKPPMPRFTTPSTTQQTGQSSSTQKTKVKPQSVTSKSAQPSSATSSSQPAPAIPVDALMSRPPPRTDTMFTGFDKPEVDSNAG